MDSKRVGAFAMMWLILAAQTVLAQSPACGPKSPKVLKVKFKYGVWGQYTIPPVQCQNEVHKGRGMFDEIGVIACQWNAAADQYIGTKQVTFERLENEDGSLNLPMVRQTWWIDVRIAPFTPAGLGYHASTGGWGHGLQTNISATFIQMLQDQFGNWFPVPGSAFAKHLDGRWLGSTMGYWEDDLGNEIDFPQFQYSPPSWVTWKWKTPSAKCCPVIMSGTAPHPADSGDPTEQYQSWSFHTHPRQPTICGYTKADITFCSTKQSN